MASTSRPVSELLRQKEREEEEPKKKSREEWRKEKELEEARKAGTVPALVDEEGNEVNPHIPQYIASAPWYYGASGPTLKHQRPQKRTSESQLIDREKGGFGSTAKKFRPGACENCGAMGHKRKDCFERPRKIPAKFSNKDIAPDEIAPREDGEMNYEAKRDRYNGFVPNKINTNFLEKLEEAKKLLARTDEDKYADNVDMPGTKVDSKQRITVRNLRIREDTAKYLRNLDLDSAYYDPKTRSMRENPYEETGKVKEELPYSGENFVRYTGETVKVSKMQLFAWQAHDKGVDVHLQAEPTKTELLHKDYEVNKSQIKNNINSKILEKYGGQEHLKKPKNELLQSEGYLEYARDGRVLKK